jgi:sugar phosphate permease
MGKDQPQEKGINTKKKAKREEIEGEDEKKKEHNA